MADTKNFRVAREKKRDEFYTSYLDVENELRHYKEHFKDAVIYCNCDDWRWSSFYLYLKNAFNHLGLKKLIATYYDESGSACKAELFPSGKETVTLLKGSGDFRSEECVSLLNEADIVITNPPFSLFREYIGLLVDKKKRFLIIGNNNAISYKEVFALIQAGQIWLGVNNNKTLEFRLHSSYEKYHRIDDVGRKYGKVPAISWFTNLTHHKRQTPIDLYCTYNPEDYPKYDNYDAIEVKKVKEIPVDYNGTMGVPITFLNKYCPEQFEIVGTQRWFYDRNLGITNGKTLINGKETYDRIFIKRK